MDTDGTPLKVFKHQVNCVELQFVVGELKEDSPEHCYHEIQTCLSDSRCCSADVDHIRVISGGLG